ncbi:SLATT domain-containing protein [Calothrix rhizosoleniae]|uniref:SLATT domain-containing protein n=1 Tax=Calothrix rhizosoleniae TaxID=888997 RepID=UPI000B497EA5|nr:SLATT domain-containing protein [Calothrix rhizosoleniae]
MNSDLNNFPQTLILLEDIARNARINKHQHFSAAERNHFSNNVFGSVAIVINITLGSVLFVTISENLPDIAKWISGFMAMIAAACGGIQTFFNFQKVFEGHRRIANQYLEIQRECERLLALFADRLIDIEGLAKEVELLNKQYSTTNNDAEVFPTGDRDFKKAQRHEQKRKENRKALRH